jgi:hypothetical protein
MSLVSKIALVVARIAAEIKSVKDSRLKNTSDTLNGNLDTTGYIKAEGFLQSNGVFYSKNDLRTLNKDRDGWVTFAERDDTTYPETVTNLPNIGTINAKGTIIGSNLSGKNTGDQDTIYPMVHSADMMMKQQTEFIKSINNNWK